MLDPLNAWSATLYSSPEAPVPPAASADATAKGTVPRAAPMEVRGRTPLGPGEMSGSRRSVPVSAERRGRRAQGVDVE
jgi:hypothetical protein